MWPTFLNLWSSTGSTKSALIVAKSVRLVAIMIRMLIPLILWMMYWKIHMGMDAALLLKLDMAAGWTTWSLNRELPDISQGCAHLYTISQRPRTRSKKVWQMLLIQGTFRCGQLNKVGMIRVSSSDWCIDVINITILGVTEYPGGFWWGGGWDPNLEKKNLIGERA